MFDGGGGTYKLERGRVEWLKGKWNMLLLPNEKSDKGDKLELSGGQLINLIKTHVKERRGGAYLERERGGGGGLKISCSKRET
jgi:transcriptional regulator CtsR